MLHWRWEEEAVAITCYINGAETGGIGFEGEEGGKDLQLGYFLSG